MFKGLFRLSMLLVTGKFLKPRVKGLLFLLSFWLLLWFLQSEYLSYVDYTGDSTYVLHASILKVSLILISLLIYIVAVERPLVKKTPVLTTKLSNKKPSTLSASFSNTGNTKSSVARDKDSNTETSNGLAGNSDDGFEFLRHNKKLKSVSDQLLDK